MKKRRQRQCRLERLEQRALLATAVFSSLIESNSEQAEGEGEALARFTYEFVSAADQSLDPNPADNIVEYRAAIGDVVKLRVYAEDLRETPQGIRTAYHDIAFTHQETSNQEILGLLYGEANVLRVEIPTGTGSYSGNYQIRYESLAGSDTTIDLSHPLADGALNAADANTVASAIQQLNWNTWVSPDFPVTTRLLPNTSQAGKDYANFAIEFTGSALRRADQPDASISSNTLQFAGSGLSSSIEVVQPNPLDPRSVSVATSFLSTEGNEWGNDRRATWKQTANGYTLVESGGSLNGTTVSSPANKKLLYEISFEVLRIGAIELSGVLSDINLAPIYLVGSGTPLTAAEIDFPQSVVFQAVEPGSDYLERNNTQPTASNLGTIEGSFRLPGLSIHNANDEDWIRFTTAANSNHSHYASITFNHLAGDLDLELYDSNGLRLAQSATSSNQEFVSLQGLAAGSYFVKVLGYQGATNLDYEFSVNLPIVDIGGDGLEANDTISTATNLGIVTAAGQLTGLSIHSVTDTDYFRFEIASQGKANQYVQIDFVHASGDLELRLYNAAGILLETAATANDFERISLAGRNAGVYFVQVRGENNARNPLYSLIIQPPTSTIDADSFEPNDSRATATNFAVTQPFYEFDQLTIHQAGNEDWYSFFLSKPGAAGHYVSATFEHSLGDIDVQLLDRNGLLVRSSTLAANEERISLSGLPVSTYYVRVYGNGNARQPSYKLGLSVPVVEVDPDFYEPANSRLAAYDLRTIAGSLSLDYLTIHTTTDEDWFRFNSAAVANSDHFVGLLYRAGDGDVDLDLLDANGTLLASSSVNDNWERISLAGRGAGTYYLRVRSNAGHLNSQYSLGFSLPTAVIAQDRFEANELRTSASDLKTISGVYSLSALSLHSSTDQDWYRFALGADAGNSHFVELQSSAISGDVNLELYDSTGNLLRQSVGAADSERVSLAGFPAGDYFLRIVGKSGATAPSYTLLFDTPLLVIAADPYESNDFRNTAYDLRAVEGGRSVRGGSIHSTTDQDWFRFQIMNLGREEHFVSLNFAQSAGDLDLTLFDANGTQIRSSTTTADSERISLNGLQGGTYFIRVSGFAGATQPAYDLEFQTPIGSALLPDRFENNNNSSSATVVRNAGNLLQGSLVLTDLTIHAGSDRDYFRFTTAAPATAAHSITLDLNVSDGDLDLELFDSMGALVRQSIQSSLIDNISLAGLPAGTYTLLVKAKSNGSNTYRLAFDTPLPATTKDDWTIMLYMASTNQEKRAFDDLNELEKAALALPGTVNLVVFWDQSSSGTKYATGSGSQTAWGTSGQGVIRPDRDPTSLATSFELLAEQNSGAASSLSNFISYATTVAPAQRYALITWGQGGGIAGLVRDDSEGTSQDVLNVSEWLQALKAPTSPHFDVLALDTSVGGLTELAYSARDVADYLVASPAAIPSDGFNYEKLFADLREQADLPASLLATALVQSFELEYATSTHQWSSLSALQLAGTVELAAAIKTWVQSVAALTVSQRDALMVQLFSGVGYWKAEYRDLGQSLQQVATNTALPQSVRNAAQGVVDALGQATISRSLNSRETTGLSITLPYSTSVVDDYKTRFDEFFAATDWDDFVIAVVDRYEEQGTANRRLGREVTQQDWSEANELPATAINLHQQNGTNITYNDLSLLRVDDVDWFRFSLGATATVAHQVRMIKEGSSAVRLDLYDAKGQTLLRTQTSSGSPTVSLNGLVAGSYMLKIAAADTSAVGNYSLIIDAPTATTPLDRTGNNQTAERAFDLGVVIQTAEHTNQTLASLGEEWFTFQSPKVPESTWYSLQVRLSSGLSADAVLKNSAGQVVSKASGSNELLLGYKAPVQGETYQLQVSSKTAIRGTFHVQIENLRATFADLAASENLAGLVIDGIPLTELVAAAGTVSLSDNRFQWQNNQLRLTSDAYLSLASEQTVFVRLSVQDSTSPGKTVSVVVPIDIAANANPWHNKKQKYNTNFDFDSQGNEVINAIDALTIINSLNRVGGSYKLPVFRRAAPGATELQYDVNDDGNVTAIDALVVINFLNSRN